MKLVGEFGVAVAQLGDLGGQRADPLAALGFGQGGVLESEQVTVDGLFGFGEVSLDGDEFGLPLLALSSLAGVGGGKGVGEQVRTVIQRDQGVEDGLVEFACGEAFGGAGGGAVAVAGEAGVVAVPVAAAVGGVADELAAAVLADDEAAEQVVG